MNEDQARRLAAALKVCAREATNAETVEESWRTLAARAIAEAKISMTLAEFEFAWRALWRSAFMGGNYTLDARRMLKAAYDREMP